MLLKLTYLWKNDSMTLLPRPASSRVVSATKNFLNQNNWNVSSQREGERSEISRILKYFTANENIPELFL